MDEDLDVEDNFDTINTCVGDGIEEENGKVGEASSDTCMVNVAENGMIHHGSSYMVPSQQTEPDENIECLQSSPELVKLSTLTHQGEDVFSDFLPVYQTVCTLANAAGVEGSRIMEQDLNILHDKQLELIARKNTPSRGGDAYHNYMHLFKGVCAYTKEAGDDGNKN